MTIIRIDPRRANPNLESNIGNSSSRDDCVSVSGEGLQQTFCRHQGISRDMVATLLACAVLAYSCSQADARERT
jgi:hypothetical protein